MFALFGLTAALLASASAGPLAPRQSSRFQTAVVFGDSYSDNCNAWRIGASPALQAQYPYPSCPPVPTGRASGGVQWPEVLKNISSNLNVYDYASSGATCNNTLFPRKIATYNNGTATNPSVVDQIATLQKTHAGNQNGFDFDVSSAVAIIFIGTNDLTFFVARYQSNQTADALQFPGESVNDEAGCVTRQVYNLYQLGFRSVLVMNNIPLQKTALFSYNRVQGYGYLVQQNGPLISAFMQQLVLTNNGLQALKLPQLAATLPGLTLKIFDTYNFYNDIINNPSAYGFTNVNGFCRQCGDDPRGSSGTCTVCSDIENYLFYDQLHPGPGAARLLAAAVQKTLNSW